jgi:hypothetical protein
MKKSWILAVAAATACMGCTTASLERHSLTQIHSTGDYRCGAALNCLAAVAADPANLPSFAVLSDGTAKVSDTGTLSSTTLWTRAVGSFAMQTMGVTAIHSPQENWTIDPVADYTQLQALRAACRWVLYGPEHANGDPPGILNSPTQDPSPGPHFGVADRLARLPAGWLHVGGLKDVPLGACYKGHFGSTWVWVMPDGTQGLADFTLVIHDIATLDPNSQATIAPPLVVYLEMHEALKPPKPSNLGSAEPAPVDAGKGKRGDAKQATEQPRNPPETKEPAGGTAGGVEPGSTKPRWPDWSTQNTTQLVFSVPRVIRPECKPWIEQKIREALCGNAAAHISWDEWMACTTPYYGARVTLSPASNLPAAAAALQGQAPLASPQMVPFGGYLLPPPNYQRTPFPPLR